MLLKLNVGLSKKLGLPDYSSIAASCHLELELDQALVIRDLAGFHERVRRTFTACRQAVEDELAQHQTAGGETAPTNQSGNSASRSNGNGTHRKSNCYRASQKQIDYAHRLAGEIKGMGPGRLETLATKIYRKQLADLSSFDASGLIDLLKSIKAGMIKLGDALSGAAERA
ncbi:MAG TPA: hypothetical protein VGY55_07725 [Pirellulales bacterium]|jgi:hypothetical protein|nr:hypothetical protein [Pirellulales bacterium]